MNTIDYKIWYYEEAIKAGTEDVHKKDKIIINKLKGSDYNEMVYEIIWFCPSYSPCGTSMVTYHRECKSLFLII